MEGFFPKTKQNKKEEKWKNKANIATTTRIIKNWMFIWFLSHHNVYECVFRGTMSALLYEKDTVRDRDGILILMYN